jgi:hypothetical protein
MKMFPILAVLVVGLFYAGCTKKKVTASGITYKGVVLHNICCLDVIQTLGSDYLGQDTWIDSNNTSFPVYQHVFTVSNPCQFGGHSTGDTIQFKVVNQEAQTCACCMIYIMTPAARYPIQVVN